MSLAQTLLSAAALVLLTVLVVNAHRLVIYSSDETVRAEARDMSVNAAQSLLNEIARKRFDENAHWWYGSTPQPTSEFTPAGSLGPESSEQISSLPDTASFKSNGNFDDVDDYHRYSRLVNTEHVRRMRCSVLVYYTNRYSPMLSLSFRTYVKRVEVRVMHESFSDRRKGNPDTLRFFRLIRY